MASLATSLPPVSPAADHESFAALFEESLSRHDMRAGEVITAEVVRVDYNFVVVNAGLKSESFIPVDEFKNDHGEIDVKPGDYVSVAIESLENGFGDTSPDVAASLPYTTGAMIDAARSAVQSGSACA